MIADVATGIAERQRAWEQERLSPLATRSYPAARTRADEECTLRTSFQRDRDQITHRNAFQHLKHKTQIS